ncbi:ABC transporter involved in cytochrome c biogenesis, CcmB subunit [hydrothermal vent metagenome]|uniref:Heme exporter protein B n=1 Tax=hydrothermal vent metagenome TaxID=652676 RepID=A0A3B0YHQ3_9ZZZZ
MSSAATAFFSVVKRDLLIAVRHRAEILNPLIYFIIITALFPLAISAEKNDLILITPGIIWIAALLSSLLSLDKLFRSDYEDGTLEQMMLSPHSTALLVTGKILAHWLVTGLPLLLIAPVLASSLQLPSQAYPALIYTILLGTPVLSLLGGIGIALTIGLRRGGILLVILMLPLYVPVLAMASSALRLSITGDPFSSQLLTLASLLTLSLTLAPLAIASALRVSLR